MPEDTEKNIINEEPKTSYLNKINKKIWVILGLFSCLVIIFILFSIYVGGLNKPNVVQKQEALIPKTTLRLENPSETASTPNLHSWQDKITISPAGKAITGVQLELAYDPKYVENVDIKAGDFIPNPVIILKNIDEKNGKITYVLGIQPGEKGIAKDGTVAIITFVDHRQTSIDTSIKFLKGTEVSAEGVSKSALETTINNLFTLGGINYYEPPGEETD